MNKHISQYLAEDFVLEDSFRAWVLQPDSPDASYWENYRLNHPQQEEELQSAKHLVLMLHSLYDTAPDPEIADSIWKGIEEKINAEAVEA